MSTIKETINQKFSEVVASLGKEKDGIMRILGTNSEEEAFCLKFLYSYMPISDIADYSPTLFLQFVKHSLKVREIMPWGNSMDDTIFLNYVLQCRINNENLEFYSEVFFNELEKRIFGLSMYEAAVKVNYWCNEKATYQTTNERTASPLTVVKNAYGRCGEESTLTVAAMRCVGIPARQVYTPRWAHCDDNHAWVEVFIDGNWHFLGACEPECRLDTGWFKFPASKGMLIHNRVLSDLQGVEHLVRNTNKMCEINLLNHYAKTKEIVIRIVNKEKKPLEHISVHFEVVNYSEFYPLTVLKTDKNGEVSFITGLGDLMIYAYHKDSYVYQKIDVREQEFLELILEDTKSEEPKQIDFTFQPPTGHIAVEEPLLEEEEKLHKKWLQESAEKRKAYEKTFFNKDSAKEYVQNYPEQKEEIAKCLIKARGNHKEIRLFLEDIETKKYMYYKVKMLLCLTQKDLSDSKAEILKDHFIQSMVYRDQYEEDIFISYLLNPRIYMEMITMFKSAVHHYIAKDELEKFKVSPQKVFEYVEETIDTYDDKEYSNLTVSPEGAFKLKKANSISKKIVITAILRTIGIPAKIQKEDLKVSYYVNGKWEYYEKDKVTKTYKKAFLHLEKASDKDTFTYYNNYTVSYLNVNEGNFVTLNLEDMSWQDNGITYMLEPGLVRIVTANRQLDGVNLVRVYYANLEEDETTHLRIELLTKEQHKKEVEIPDTIIGTLDGRKEKLSKIIEVPNTVIAWLCVGDEPTEHLLNEIIQFREKWNNLNPNLVLVLRNQKEYEDVTLKKTLEAVSCIQIVIEKEYDNLDSICENFQIKDKRLPLALVIGENQKASFAFSGYNVGIGELLLKSLQFK